MKKRFIITMFIVVYAIIGIIIIMEGTTIEKYSLLTWMVIKFLGFSFLFVSIAMIAKFKHLTTKI